VIYNNNLAYIYTCKRIVQWNNCIVNHSVWTMTVWIAITPCCVWRWFHLCVQPVDPQAVVCLLWVYVCPILYKEHHHCLRTAAVMNCLQMPQHSRHPHEHQSERWRDKKNKEIHMSHSTEGNVWIMFSLNLSCFIKDHIQFRGERPLLWCTETGKL